MDEQEKKKDFFFKRMKKYSKIRGLLSKENQVDKCGLIPFHYSKIGEGNEGIIYLLKFDRQDSLVVKVMRDDENNIREVKNYDLFRYIVLSNRLPHFPLTWESIHCGDKCHFVDLNLISHKKRWERIKEKECFLLFMEMFDGVFYELLKKEKEERKKSIILSMFFQIMMAMKLLEEKNLVHGDLHLNNILYKKMGKTGKRKYFRYIIGVENVYDVRHFGMLFVLSDFEKMKPTGTVSAHAYDKEWLQSHVNTTFSINEPLNSLYWDMYVLTSSLSFFSKDFKEISKLFLKYTLDYNKTKKGPSIKTLIHDFATQFKGKVIKINKEEKDENIMKTFFL